MVEFKVRIIHDRRGNIKKGRRDIAPVEIEVGVIGISDRRFIPTRVNLAKGDFKCGYPLKLRKTNLSEALETQIMLVYNKVTEYIRSPYCKSLDDVPNWNKDVQERNSFLEFIVKQIEGSENSEGTKKTYWSLYTRLKEFKKIQFFEDLTYKNIVEFNKYLRLEINSLKVLQKRHNLMIKLISEAIKSDYMTNNPYDKFEIPRGNNQKRPVSLTKDEVKAIEAYTPSHKRMIECRDMFLLQVYTGLAYVDMQHLTKLSIDTIDNIKVIRSNRQKTDACFIVPLSTKALQILERYDYKMPQRSNAYYNRALKDLALRVGITKNVTTHMARHTFATYALNEGVMINELSKILGHTSIRHTEHYAKIMPETIIEGTRNIPLFA